MTWWAWLAIGWLAVAVIGAFGLGTALRIAERRERIRRGRPGVPTLPRPRAAEPNVVDPSPVFSDESDTASRP